VTRHGTMNADPAAFILPRLVSAVSPDAPIVSEEQFGPVLPLVEYSDLEEAIMMANASEFGLCSSAWTDNPGRGSTVARRISAGTMLVDAHTLSAVDGRTPFGGMRQSGTGREGGRESLAALSEAHTITVRA
jgi:aldehyde dehydrogenase